eukprot:35051_1
MSEPMASKSLEYVDTLLNLSESMRRSRATNTIPVNDESKDSTPNLSTDSRTSSNSNKNSTCPVNADLPSAKSSVKPETTSQPTNGLSPRMSPVLSAYHSKYHKFKCISCDQSFQNKTELVSHELKHAGCPQCLAKFASNVNLRDHVLECHSRFMCIYCQNVYITQFHLSEHMKVHAVPTLPKPKQYVCTVCGRENLSASRHKQHLLLHNTENRHLNLWCTECSRRFFSNEQFVRHMKRHRAKFVCHFCNAKYLILSHFKYHVMLHTGERPCACKYCSNRFITQSNLNKHMARAHVLSHRCHKCAQKFVQYTDLVDHIFKTHKMKHRCSKCDTEFNTLEDLKTHTWEGMGCQKVARSHPVLAHSCNKCPDSFGSWTELLDHIFKKHSTKHSCPKCHGKFGTLDDLKKHTWKKNGCQNVTKSHHI